MAPASAEASRFGLAAVARPSAPPWLLWLTSGIVVVFTIGRIWLAAALDLRIDESYYWTWSQHLVSSYLDHPPLVAWFIRLGTTLLGETTLGARAAQLVGMAAMELLLADIVRRRTVSITAALLVVLALESSVYFGVTSAFLEPGIPLALFLTLAFWSLVRLDETGRGEWWLAIGAAMGLALLSKYTAVLAVSGFLAYTLMPARNRRWLVSPWLWAGLALALLIFLPVLWWNWQHDWYSFRFQGARAGAVPPANLETSSTFVLVTLIYAGPLLGPAAVLAAAQSIWRARRAPDPITLALAVAFLLPLAYVFERALHLWINPTWAVQIWPLGYAVLAIAAHQALAAGRPMLFRAASVVVIAGLPLPALLLFHGTTDRSPWPGAVDLLGGEAGYDTAAEAILATAKEEGATWIATGTYHRFAVLSWQLRGRMPVIQVTERSRYLGWQEQLPNDLTTARGLYVYQGDPDALVDAGTTAMRQLPDVARIWRSKEVGTLQVRLIEGWTAPLQPAPGSPYYQWRSLV